MENIILNRQKVLTNDFNGKLEPLLNSAEQAILSVKPETLLRNSMVLEDRDTLKIMGRCIDLYRYERIFVGITGKASGPAAEVVERILTPRGSERSLINEGIAIVPPGVKQKTRTAVIEVIESDHPTPTERGVYAGSRLMNLASRADERTLFILIISGGASSLNTLPQPDVPLRDSIAMNGIMLGVGAEISEINAVRKHISAISGGRLAGKTKGGLVVSLIVSDVVGDDIGSIGSGLTAPDKTTFKDVLEIFRKYDIVGEVPRSVLRHVQRGAEGRVSETLKPDDPIFNRVANIIIGNNQLACYAAIASIRASEPDRRVYYLGSDLVGDAGIEGTKFARMVLRFQQMGKKIAFVGGGERTVILSKNPGLGGRNQQEALYAMKVLGENKYVSAVYLGSDGIDGNSYAAGAAFNSVIYDRISEGIDRGITQNSSNTLLNGADAAIITGPSGTNVYDIKAISIN
ncbi:MAG: DUF4147 domain-containing protein [Candidatus Micrarchaeota archaeon]|nr:DUF4147 domain-containing protein [Candidatus Micrarchaeota archaeon]